MQLQKIAQSDVARLVRVQNMLCAHAAWVIVWIIFLPEWGQTESEEPANAAAAQIATVREEWRC